MRTIDTFGCPLDTFGFMVSLVGLELRDLPFFIGDSLERFDGRNQTPNALQTMEDRMFM